MATIELTTSNFEDVIAKHDVVLVDFWASWCGPCRTFGPIFERVSEQFPNAVFGKVDTEAQGALAASFNIMSIPTLMIIRDQVVLFNQAGALPESALVDVTNQVLALDMDDIRRQLSATTSSSEGN